MPAMRVGVTDAARAAVAAVRASGRDDLVVVLSNGCCDATAPYLYSGHIPPAGSVMVAEISGVSVLAPDWICGLYNDDDTLLIDAIEQPADDSLSLETDDAVRLVLRAPGNEGRG